MKHIVTKSTAKRMYDARHFRAHAQIHYMKMGTTTKNELNRLKGLKVLENSLLKQNCNR